MFGCGGGNTTIVNYEPPGAKAPGQYAPPPAVGIPTGGPQVTYASTLRPQPTPGIPTRGPERAPAPSDVLLGYEMCQPQTGCCECNGLSMTGMLAVILLLFIFWPAAFIPCLMPECFEPYQRPVYGPRS
ncbi:hypothetical protein WJX84_003908 [Apatococcus fuscideae]|uniref:Uncharacterized protein n=1 Tax=Apatococcus fuscideae TaxID=2026836 RepID=A0AAW1SP92_9CHLO